MNRGVKYFIKKPIILTVIGLTVASLVLVQVLPLFYNNSKAAASFQANYNGGSTNADFSLGSSAASTDTSLPSLATGYNSTNSLSYSYDGTSTLKYATASNLPADKGSIEMKFQKSAYGDATDQDKGSLNSPRGIYYDSASEYIFIVDTSNNRIVKTKIDGTGWQAYGHYGTGIGQFNAPAAITYNPNTSEIYVADAGNSRIVITKIDGSGWRTIADAPSGNASFGNARSITLDVANNFLYLGVLFNVYKINLTNNAITLSQEWAYMHGSAYDPTTEFHYRVTSNNTTCRLTKSKFDGSESSYVDLSQDCGWWYFYDTTQGDLYVDSVNQKVYFESGQGIVRLNTDLTGTESLTGSAWGGIHYDAASNYIYVADKNNNRIIKTQIDATGRTYYGSYYNNSLKFNGPTGSYYDATSGYYYIADSENNRIVKTKIDGTGWQTFGTLGGGTNQFSYPTDVYYESSTQYLYIADNSNLRIVKTKIDGTGWQTIATGSGKYPRSISKDGESDYVFVAFRDASCGNILKIKKDFTETLSFGSDYCYAAATYDAETNYVYSVGPYTAGIKRMRPDGTGAETYGSAGSGVDQFNASAVWYDSASEYLYVADTNNYRIVKTKWGGSGWTTYGSNGSGSGQFAAGYKSIMYDSTSANIIVSDPSNGRVVRTQIDGTGWQTTKDFVLKEKILYAAQATDDSRLVYDVVSRKLRFYLAYSNKAQFVETPTLNLTDGNWYTVKASFNKAAHTLSIDLNGTNQATATYDSDWGSLSYGTSFYIGARNGSTTDRWDGMIDDVNVDIESVDAVAPTNPTAGNTHFYSDGTKAVSFTSDSWGNSATPYITWSGASDADSGLKGYYLYLGTTAGAEPNTTSGLLTPNSGSKLFQTHVGANGAEQNVTVPASSLVSGVTYYFILRSQDNDLNSADKTTLFTYKYDGGAPNPPEFINASPAGCSTSSTFTFTWGAITDPTSGIAGYEYKNGSSGTATNAGNVTTLELAPYQDGDNIVYIRTKDNAGNTSSWQTAVYCSTGIAHVIDGPTVVAGPSSITVSWTSNKQTTSSVQVYDGNTYISEQGQTSYGISHSVKVIGLKPEKDYRYKLTWADQSGNISESTWYTTKTDTVPQVTDLKADIQSPSKANLTWKTNYPSSERIEFGLSNYENALTIGGSGTDFSKLLENLQGGANYSVRIIATTSDGSDFSAGITFQTPPLPSVSALHFESILGLAQPAMKATWTTNVETTSTLYFGIQGGTKTEISKSDKVKEHEIQIDNLSDNTTYEAYVTGTDSFGNTAKSDINTFKTSVDTRAPVISNISTESSNVGSGQTSTAQVTVGYRTDESAMCSVDYGEGISGTNYIGKAPNDESYSTNHLSVISGLKPQNPYHFKVNCQDKAGNPASSSDQTVISGEITQSVFNIIIKTLNNLFGWLGKVI